MSSVYVWTVVFFKQTDVRTAQSGGWTSSSASPRLQHDPTPLKWLVGRPTPRLTRPPLQGGKAALTAVSRRVVGVAPSNRRPCICAAGVNNLIALPASASTFHTHSYIHWKFPVCASLAAVVLSLAIATYYFSSRISRHLPGFFLLRKN